MLSKSKRPAVPSRAVSAQEEEVYVAAYRSMESKREKDPFSDPMLQELISSEANLRVRRKSFGPTGWFTRWIQSAPRPALAGAAVSLALLITSAPLGSLQPTAAPMMRSEPALQAVELESGTHDSLPTPGNVAGDLPSTAADTPWLAITGAVGLALSLIAAETVRRRRRA